MDSPGEIAKRWAARLGAEVGKWEKGVRDTTVSPTQKAADNIQGYLAGVQAAVNSGKTEAALRAVSNEQWKSRTITKGRERLASGATEAVPRMTAFLTEFLPALESIRQRVNSMPSDSRAARMAKAMEMMRALGEWGDNRRGR